MADTDKPTEEGVEIPAPKKSPLKAVILYVVPALLLGAGGFFATYSGMIGLGGDESHAEPEPRAEPASFDTAFMETDQLIIPLSPRAGSRNLLFKATIEVAPQDLAALEAIRPRITDVFNTFLRAVDGTTISEPSAMPRLRAQLLRRLRTVVAPVSPRDLLITHFVLK